MAMRVCKATEEQVWGMINGRMHSREDCWAAMRFIESHDFVNVDDPEYDIYDSWMKALGWLANNEFNC